MAGQRQLDSVSSRGLEQSVDVVRAVSAVRVDRLMIPGFHRIVHVAFASEHPSDPWVDAAVVVQLIRCSFAPLSYINAKQHICTDTHTQTSARAEIYI